MSHDQWQTLPPRALNDVSKKMNREQTEGRVQPLSIAIPSPTMRQI